jgi:hypothetical protein
MTRFVKIPVVTLSRQQVKRRLADVKKRSGKSLSVSKFGKLGKPVASPHLRRRHGFCRVLDPEEWNLVFPDIPSEYGGTVCVRK